MKHFLYILIMIPLLFANCSTGSVSVENLGKIAEMIQKEPKKALDSLQKINSVQLKGEHSRALYALLYSQAKDKNWIDETDDSLISTAVNYFERSNDAYCKFLSYFYWGRVNQNAGNLAKSIVAFTKAEDMVGQIEDNYSVGLLYANMGLIYQDIYDFQKSLDAFHRACNHYMLAGKLSHAMYAKLNIGNMLLSTKQFEDAEICLREVMEWAYKNKDYITAQDSFYLLANLYEQTNDENAIKGLFASEYFKICKESFKSLQYQAYVYALERRFGKAHECIEKAWSKPLAEKDSVILYRREYSVYKLEGDYKKALGKHEKVLVNLDTDVRRKLQYPVLTMQKDYYKDEARYNALLLEKNREKQFVVAVAAIVVFVLGFALYVRRIRVKQKRMEGYMDKIQDLERLLLSVNADKDNIETEMSEKVYGLFQTQFNLIDKLSTTYYETHGSQKDKDAIYKQVTNEIEKLSVNKKYLSDLEDIVNRHMNGIMQKTREAMPQLSEMDFRLLCYIYAGFSAKAISIFTNNSTGNIYMKKSRIKERVSMSDSQYKHIILKYLG